MLRRIKNNSATVLIVFLFWSCSASPKFTSDDPHPSRPKPERPARDIESNENKKDELSEFHNVTILDTQTGTASFYGDDFHGKLTSNGEVYDMYGISAAHPTYPSGTIIKVTNLSNSKTEVLRINDRMPQHPDRIIDLSYGAAKKLDMVNDGLTEVKIEVLKWGDGEYKK